MIPDYEADIQKAGWRRGVDRERNQRLSHRIKPCLKTDLPSGSGTLHSGVHSLETDRILKDANI